MNIGQVPSPPIQITKSLEIINEAYNKFYIEKIPKNAELIEKV